MKDSQGREITTTTGRPIDETTRLIDERTGMQNDYVVLSAEERAKGFVRPLRRSYRHVGAAPQYPLRALTETEKGMHPGSGYVAFEEYPESAYPVTGRFWTQEGLDRKGCGAVTTMGQELAETYARDPKFYSGTFCAVCRLHCPLEEFVWDGTDIKVGS